MKDFNNETLAIANAWLDPEVLTSQLWSLRTNNTIYHTTGTYEPIVVLSYW